MWVLFQKDCGRDLLVVIVTLHQITKVGLWIAPVNKSIPTVLVVIAAGSGTVIASNHPYYVDIWIVKNCGGSILS